jgi:hypothetical protein
MYGDRKMPAGTAFNLTGGGTQNFGGAIYLPKANLNFAGGNGTTTSCTKVIADSIAFTGASNLQVNCGRAGDCRNRQHHRTTCRINPGTGLR